MDHIEWKYQDFIDQDWLDYFVVAMDQQGRVFFAAKELGSDLAAGIYSTIGKDPNAIVAVNRMLFVLGMVKGRLEKDGKKI